MYYDGFKAGPSHNTRLPQARVWYKGGPALNPLKYIGQEWIIIIVKIDLVPVLNMQIDSSYSRDKSRKYANTFTIMLQNTAILRLFKTKNIQN